MHLLTFRGCAVSLALTLSLTMPVGSAEAPQASAYSHEKEAALGKILAAEVERNFKPLQDSVVAQYVNELGQRLAASSTMPFPLTVKLVDATELMATALPGGYLIISSGLFSAVSSESELAGVMAHEIAHIAARHGTRQASKGAVAGVVSVPLVFMGGWTGVCTRFGHQNFMPVALQQASRGWEREADMFGIEYLYKAGYDPTGLVTVFQRLQPKSRADTPPADNLKFDEMKRRLPAGEARINAIPSALPD
jgi:predicted Zn-dependent protease